MTSQQAIAKITFRLFGFDDLLKYYSKNHFNKLSKYSIPFERKSHVNGSTDIVKQATKIIKEFINKSEAAQKGKCYINSISEYKSEFTTKTLAGDVISFSKVLSDKEVIVAYNCSDTEAKEYFILLHNHIATENTNLNTVYGYKSCKHIVYQI